MRLLLGDLEPHEPRHTYASLPISAGADAKAAQALLGHEKASATLDTCADLFDDDLDDVARRLDEIVGAMQSGKTHASEMRQIEENDPLWESVA